jgi:hypothetical protein
MKYLFFFNGQPLLLCCMCCKIAIQDFLTGLHKKNKKNLRSHRQVYRRTITRRYFTESWKTFTGLCHNHQRLYRQKITRRYFTESCKKITGLCHNHRWSYRRQIPTESPTDVRTSQSARMYDTCPSTQIPTALLTSNTDGLTNGITHIPKRRHVWHVSVYTNTDGVSNGLKSLAGFLNFFWCVFQLISNGITDGI